MRSVILFVALLVFIPCAAGQTASLAINSAALNIDPTSTDSYTLQGAFTSLDFTGAQSVTLQVGPFSSTLPIAAFTSPSSGVLNYQDSTGQSPYWISSLTIDTNASTFTAQATGVVLSGIENPFMVQFGTDTAYGCSMARVQQTDVGVYQLNPGDGANEPCQIAEVTTITPTIPVGVSTNVLFQLNVFEGADFDPSTLQIFRVDANAQPSGAPLCSLSDNGDGTYGCTVTFNEAAPTTIPLLAQASAGAQTILSPGFSITVAPPFTADNEQEVADIQNALSQAQQNWVQYGDTPYARVLTMQALRTAMEPEPGLTGQPVELCPDGLSIGIRTSSGFMMMFLLNDLSDVVGTQPTSSAALRPRLRKTRVLARRTRSSTHARAVTPKAVNADGSPALVCDAPQRDIVYNSSVLIWDPGSVFFGSADYLTPAITSKIGESKCPNFNVRQLPGPQADVNSFYEFPDYGTIVLDSHGTVDPNHRGAIMTGQVISTGLAAFFSNSNYSPTGDLAGICTLLGTNVSILGYQYVGAGCFLSVYASFVTRATAGLGNSIIYAGICDGAVGNLDLAQAFTPPGSNNAYYGFQGISNTGDDATVGPAVFDALIHQHTNTATAWHLAPPPTRSAPLIQFGDPNLAYLGNPKLFSPEGLDLAFALGPGGSANLRAQIDGASSCDLIMNYHWINSANVGHLTPDDGSSGQDNFTSLDPQTIYKAFPGGMGVDAVVVDFLPDVNDPPAARACTTGDVNTGLFLSFEFKAHGEWSEDYNNGESETAQLDWDAFWDVPINPLGGLLALSPALPQTTVTGDTEAMGPLAQCSGPPVINTNHGNGPTPLPLSPYLGGASIDPSTSVQSMVVETFGGYDYHLCDGGLPTVGNYGPPEPGYPTWDTPAGYMKFNLNLNDWIGQPDHSITMSLPDLSLDTIPDDLSFGTGFTEVTGAILTITSRTVVTPPANPSSISKPVR